MSKIITEAPDGFKVAITTYRDGECEVETTTPHGISLYLWFDRPHQLLFLADVLNDYITEYELKKEKNNAKR